MRRCTAMSVQDLDELLAQPLQAAFSRRFFTGVPSASLAALPAAKPPAGEQPQAAANAAAEDAPARGALAVGGSPDANLGSSQEAQQQQREREQGLKHTVALAQNLASNRQHGKVRAVHSCCASATVPFRVDLTCGACMQMPNLAASNLTLFGIKISQTASCCTRLLLTCVHLPPSAHGRVVLPCVDA